MVTQSSLKIPAIVILIDSGIALFLAWDVVRDHLLGRFQEENFSSLQPLVGFITYGTPGSDGCPVLASRSFAEGAHQLRENPDVFKIGHSYPAAGSSPGILGGYAAAIEMFDTFRNDINQEMFSYHLWHCAGAQPDDAQSLPWNTLTWETLPAELTKRDIAYSTIALTSPTFGLSSTDSDAPVIPWFPTCPVHTIPLPRFTPSPGPGSNDQWVGVLELWHTDSPLRVRVATDEPCGDLLASTWPKVLSLELVQSTVSITKFQAWMRACMKNTTPPPAMVRFIPASDSDKHDFSQLVNLLRGHSYYSTASWVIKGNNRPSKNLLLRPCLHDGESVLLGGAFPVSGMRDSTGRLSVR